MDLSSPGLSSDMSPNGEPQDHLWAKTLRTQQHLQNHGRPASGASRTEQGPPRRQDEETDLNITLLIADRAAHGGNEGRPVQARTAVYVLA